MADLSVFEGFGKIPRLRREATITEKLDGTNAAVVVRPAPEGDYVCAPHEVATMTFNDAGLAQHWVVAAQSRNRFVSPATGDNAGFGAWVWDNAHTLARLLGVGRHFGEWWGKGIQRGYGLDEKRFSLFNTARWGHLSAVTEDYATDYQLYELGVRVVPVMHVGIFDTAMVDAMVESLRLDGSRAAPGFKPAEGVMVYHSAANQYFKRLVEKDELSKTEAGIA